MSTIEFSKLPADSQTTLKHLHALERGLYPNGTQIRPQQPLPLVPEYLVAAIFHGCNGDYHCRTIDCRTPLLALQKMGLIEHVPGALLVYRTWKLLDGRTMQTSLETESASLHVYLQDGQGAARLVISARAHDDMPNWRLSPDGMSMMEQGATVADKKADHTPRRGARTSVPPLDKSSREWVQSKEAAKLEGVETDTLARYRQVNEGGSVEADLMCGFDKDGRAWARYGTKTSHVWYYTPTLVTQRHASTKNKGG